MSSNSHSVCLNLETSGNIWADSHTPGWVEHQLIFCHWCCSVQSELLWLICDLWSEEAEHLLKKTNSAAQTSVWLHSCVCSRAATTRLFINYSSTNKVTCCNYSNLWITVIIDLFKRIFEKDFKEWSQNVLISLLIWIFSVFSSFRIKSE